MIRIDKMSFYHFFPVFSIICLILMRLIESNYSFRQQQLFSEYLYFNILTPFFYLFLIGYFITLFLSIELPGKTSSVLNIEKRVNMKKQ